MAAIFKKDGKHFLKFVDSQGNERIMELREGKKYLTEEFERRKKILMECKKNLQNMYTSNTKLSNFFTLSSNSSFFNRNNFLIF